MIAVLTGAGMMLLAVGLGIGYFRWRMVIVTVDGISMEPTLTAGDRLVARRVPVSRLKVGQIVILEHPVWRTDHWEWAPPGNGPVSGRRWLIKRVAALPGGPVPEQVLPAVGGVIGALVPPDALVVLGDNVHASIDCRELGYVPANLVLGAALRRYGARRPAADHRPRAADNGRHGQDPRVYRSTVA